MSVTTSPAKRLKSPPAEAPRMPAGFAKCPESRRIMEEMIFNHRFESRSHEANMAGVNEVAAVSASGGRFRVGTSSLSSCVALAAYDPERRVGAVAHVPLEGAETAAQKVGCMLRWMLEAADMVGGKKYSLYSFNARSEQQPLNGKLPPMLDRMFMELMDSGVARAYEHRDEHNFVLDTRNGKFLTGL